MSNEAINQLFELDHFADQRVWLVWRNEIRNGTKTKVPYSAVGRKAKSDDPTTWIDLDRAAALAPKMINGLGGGIGVILGIDCGDDWQLGGIDLDTCTAGAEVSDAVVEPWAREVIERINSYTEVSPSLTGFKIFFRYRVADLPRLRDLMGTEHGKMFKRAGKGHPPAIEFHVSNRYFAVTGDVPDGFPTTIRAVEFAELAWVIRDAGPRFVRPEQVDGPTATTPVRNEVPHDQSRSGVAFRKVAALRHAGQIRSYMDMRAALMADPDTAAWTNEKGLRNQERELKRLWDKTTPLPGTVAETIADMAQTFADEQDELGATDGKTSHSDKRDAGSDTESDEDRGSDTRYRMGPQGLFYNPHPSKKQAQVDGEAAKSVWLSPPFEVAARTRDADGNWGKLLRWNDHDGREVTWVMPGRLLGGHRDELWQALYERGFEISSALEARNLLLAYLTHADPAGRAEVVSRLGWHDGATGATAFVLPDQVFGGETGTKIICAGLTGGNSYGREDHSANGATGSDDSVRVTPGSFSRPQWPLPRRSSG